MKNEVIYIEFAGLPGAGKTTVAQRVGQLLPVYNHSVFTRENMMDHRSRLSGLHRGISLAIFLSRNFFLVVSVMVFGLLFRPVNYFSLKYAYGCVRTIFKIRTAIKAAQQAGHDTVIFDQGILQDFWSIGITGTPVKNAQLGDHLFNLLKRICKKVDFSTVLLEARSEQAVARILARDPSPYRFDNMDKNTLLNTLNQKSDYMQLIGATVRRLNSHSQLVIDTNSTSVETSAQRVVAFMTDEVYPVA